MTLRAGAENKEAVRKAISETNLEASTGTIAFNALGEVKKDVQIQIGKDETGGIIQLLVTQNFWLLLINKNKGLKALLFLTRKEEV